MRIKHAGAVPLKRAASSLEARRNGQEDDAHFLHSIPASPDELEALVNNELLIAEKNDLPNLNNSIGANETYAVSDEEPNPKKPIFNGYDWVPFYEEMADKLVNYRDKQVLLIKILQDSGVNGLIDQNPKDKAVALTEIDPFTFVALLNKQSHRKRTALLKNIKPRLNIDANVPEGFFGIPTADPRQAWLFPYRFERDGNDVSKLWDLFEEVQKKEKISEEVFASARAVKFAGRAKLTQAIFRVAPKKYFPIDGQTVGYLAGLRLANKFQNAKEFQDICKQVSSRVAKPLYEQSYDAWFLNQRKPPNPEAEYQRKVMAAAAKETIVIEGKGGVPVPKLGKTGVSNVGFQRSPNVAAAALKLANFKCEISAAHETFISNAKGKPYVEAHHLIPFGRQGGFDYSIDVTANIVALCPNCHRRLHHGKKIDKTKEISDLFAQRKDRLREKMLKITETELLKFYNGDLAEDN